MINVAVIGAGSIGAHHARIYSAMEDVSLTGVIDIDETRAGEIASKYSSSPYADYREVLDRVDAVSIAAPTTLHYRIAIDCLRHDKDILVEKPVTTTLREADELISEADKRNLILQVGHLERFNAAVRLVSRMVDQPRFIESHRISPFLGRGIDVDVTLDLMIHDIDIILSLVHADISDLRAAGAKVLTENIDIAHAWIEFSNGCIAEAVTSRIAEQKLRKLRIFQRNASLDLDYQRQEIICYRKSEGSVIKEIQKAENREPLKEELASFIACIKSRKRPLVSGREGKKALQVALRISDLVHHGLSV